MYHTFGSTVFSSHSTDQHGILVVFPVTKALKSAFGVYTLLTTRVVVHCAFVKVDTFALVPDIRSESSSTRADIATTRQILAVVLTAATIRATCLFLWPIPMASNFITLVSTIVYQIANLIVRNTFKIRTFELWKKYRNDLTPIDH